LAAQQKVEARPKKWLIPLILVWLREENSSYGYEIMESLEEEFGFEQIDPATVYRTLRQMENEGLCKSEWETFEHDGKANRMYAITVAGEAFLETWVEACEQYRRVTDTLSRVYKGRPPRSSEPNEISSS
jgi:poly-beta-hydroxybutyrate-responsive repressor